MALCGRRSMLLWAALTGAGAQAQTQALPSWDALKGETPGASLQQCRAMNDNPVAQLACFKQWAEGADVAAPLPPVAPLPARSVDYKPAGCRNSNYSGLSRFWELQRATDCDILSLRGYLPITLAVATSDSVNTQPTSTSPGYTALSSQPYKRTENKIQLSIRTKVLKGVLKNGAAEDSDQDSLWFGYTQRSYWQLYNPGMSGAFRTTDHEPELIYIYPHQIALAGGWSYRLSGLGLVHQSNGQDQPLHREWDRAYLMGAAEKQLGPNSSLTLQGKIWKRFRMSTAYDANPGIENYIGRAELAASWQIDKTNTFGVSVRHSLQRTANGSTRLDWMLAPASSPSYHSLRYHLQFFTGYGDSLIDFNRRRNVISVGVSLVDW